MFVVNLPFLTLFFDFRLFCPRKYQILVFRPKFFFKKSEFFRSVPVVEKIRNSQKLFIYIINVTTKNFRSLGLSKSVQRRPKFEDKKRSVFIIFIYIQRPQNKTLKHGLFSYKCRNDIHLVNSSLCK